MFKFFESLIKPFPAKEPKQPPKSLLAFCYHYTRGIELHLLGMSLLTAAIAAMEVSLFAFLGQLVDWLSSKQPDTLLLDEGWSLFWWAAMLLLALPAAILIHSMLLHQSLLGNYPMIIRWQAHRYLLGQSFAFYQNEFAGRIATKLMQTSLSVREAVLKLLDVILYVAVYFSGIVFIAAATDFRLTAPLLGWLIAYIGILYICIPRLKSISARQADARSSMTGRLVDTYTNIATVKLFSHSKRESEYAQQGMNSFLNTVYPQMRLATTLTFSVWIINVLLIFAVTALSIWLWMQGAVTAGAITAAIGLILRLWYVAMDNVGNIHAV